MLKKIVLAIIILLLSCGFWVSQNFKEIATGLALFLFGMMCLENGFKTFTGGVLETLLGKFTSHKWKSLVFGIVSTSLLQSSTLVSLVTISFVSAGMISLVAGISIVLGANIGTTFTALIASLSNPNDGAISIAFVHILFNLVGVTIFMLIPYLQKLPIFLA